MALEKCALALRVCEPARAKFSADTLSNLAVRVVEGSSTDGEALKDAMTGVNTVVSFSHLILVSSERKPWTF